MAGELYGISGFVDGFVNGRNQRNSWDDRKLDRARQERLDGESAEEHAARMRAYDRQDADWKRKREDDDRVRAATRLVYGDGSAPSDGGSTPSLNEPLGVTATATDASQGAAPMIPMQPAPAGQASPAGPQPSTSTATMGGPVAAMPAAPQIPQGPAGGPAPVARMPGQSQIPPQMMQGPAGGPAPQPMGVSPMPTAAAQPMPHPGQNMQAGAAQASPALQTGPDPSMGQVVAIPGSTEQMLLRPDGSVYWLSTGQRETDEGIIGAVRELAVPIQQAPKRAMQPVDPVQAQNDAKLKAARDQNIAMIKAPDRNPDYNHSWGNSLSSDASEAMKVVGAAAYNGVGAVADIVNSGINMASSGVNAAADYVAGQNVPDIPMIKPTPRMGAATPSPAPAPGQPSTPDAAEKAATQSAIQVAASAGPAMGVQPGDKITPAQRDKAGAAGYDHYMKVGADAVFKAYMLNGDLEGAQKYQEYLDQKDTKDGIRSWSKAIFAMQSGDFEGAGDAIIEAYNNLGYFPDGTTIVKDQSGFVYGDKANPQRPTGAKVTFKDEDSGKTWVQDFSSPNDFLELAFTMVSPEAGFQHFSEKVAADQAGAADAAKLKMDTQVKIADAIAAEKKILVGAINGGMPTPEQLAQAEIDAAMNVYARLGISPPAGIAAPDPLGVSTAPEGGAPTEQPIIARRPTN